MATRSSGTFVISWAQTELDGLTAAPVRSLEIGSTWSWSGSATPIGEPGDILVLDTPDLARETRLRASNQLRRFLGQAGLQVDPGNADRNHEPLFESSFELTDGQMAYRAILVDIGRGQNPLLLFSSGLPPKDQDLWVVSGTLTPKVTDPSADLMAGTICFTPGTRILTPQGAIPVEELQEGDTVSTKDNGPQAVRWIGSRQVSGGRLIAMPHLRPIRVRAHVLGDGEPDADLILSPDHRLLVKGQASETLFNSHEVLVTARDLVNDTSILPDFRCRGVTYIHLMLDHHQVVWANGVEVESFHPAGMSVDRLAPEQRNNLFARFPEVQKDPQHYGAFVRRNLTQPEAAILTYGALSGH